VTLDQAETLATELVRLGLEVAGVGHCGTGYAVFLTDGSYIDHWIMRPA
jgi:hypothetical protein